MKERFYYKRVKKDGVCIDEHRFIVEKLTGRKLKRNEVVHHLNGDKFDNSPDNLVIMTRRDHSMLHQIGRHYGDSTRQKVSRNSTSQWANNRDAMLQSSHARKVAAYQKDGTLVKVYDSMLSAEKDGYFNQHISEVAMGKRKTHRGLVWKFV